MKKIALVLSVVLMLTTLLTTFASAAELPLRVVVNGKKLSFPDAQPFIDSKSRTQVPSRFIAEALGAKTTWNEKEQKATFEIGKNKLVLTIGQKTYQLNGVNRTMDTAALVKQNRTYVPARYVAQAFGAKVKWDDQVNTVYISSDGTFPTPEPIIEEGTTLDYDGILFNDVTDVDELGRMSVDKAKEFSLKMAKTIELVGKDGNYDIKGTYPEIPSEFKWDFSVQIFEDNTEHYYSNITKFSEYKIPNTTSFTKNTIYTNKTKDNIESIVIILVILPKDTSKLNPSTYPSLGLFEIVKEPAGKYRANFVPYSASTPQEKYTDFDFKKTFQW